MTISTVNKAKSVRFLPKIFTRLMLGISISLMLFPTEEATADSPTIYSDSAIVSMSYDECKNRSIKAARAVFSKIEPSEKSGEQFKIFGATTSTVAVIYCIERPGGTVLMLTTTSYWSKNEALSVMQRLANLINNGF